MTPAQRTALDALVQRVERFAVGGPGDAVWRAVACLRDDPELAAAVGIRPPADGEESFAQAARERAESGGAAGLASVTRLNPVVRSLAEASATSWPDGGTGGTVHRLDVLPVQLNVLCGRPGDRFVPEVLDDLAGHTTTIRLYDRPQGEVVGEAIVLRHANWMVVANVQISVGRGDDERGRAGHVNAVSEELLSKAIRLAELEGAILALLLPMTSTMAQGRLLALGFERGGDVWHLIPGGHRG